jgi:hypothetical protein
MGQSSLFTWAIHLQALPVDLGRLLPEGQLVLITIDPDPTSLLLSRPLICVIASKPDGGAR